MEDSIQMTIFPAMSLHLDDSVHLSSALAWILAIGETELPKTVEPTAMNLDWRRILKSARVLRWLML